jgi:hypothetical protein
MDWEKVTIFISSTFNDMHRERDYLVKNVFPELREWCEQRKIHLVDVDLRWGVTAEDTKNNNALKVCLKNIDKSRPFFLCFLGQRQGWVPEEDKISEDTFKKYPETIDYVKDKQSITEMEVEYSHLNPLFRAIGENETQKCPKTKHALFYFMEDKYTEKLNNEQKKVYTNHYNPKEIQKDEKLNVLITWKN